ncbi:MAG TPA: MerR family transcriptional regulator [Actinocrinis sp.]|jgi:DNA-binding transcriptional MerR regulator
MDGAAQWTLDELSELVAGALRVDYHGQPSRRVREVPDRRTIRWYTTIGLLDRPAAMRGRTALYGRRHLIQLVAVKRLQAQGRSLVDVQSALVGATDAALEDIARIPVGAAESNGSADVAAEEPEAVGSQVPAPLPTPAQAVAPARSTLRFWAAGPAAPGVECGTEDDTVTVAAGGDGTNSARTVKSSGSGESTDDTEITESTESTGAAALHQPTATPVPALRLGSGVALLLGSAGRTPTAEDARLIGEAAGPLLDLLNRLGLDLPGPGREIR